MATLNLQDGNDIDNRSPNGSDDEGSPNAPIKKIDPNIKEIMDLNPHQNSFIKSPQKKNISEESANATTLDNKVIEPFDKDRSMKSIEGINADESGLDSPPMSFTPSPASTPIQSPRQSFVQSRQLSSRSKVTGDSKRNVASSRNLANKNLAYKNSRSVRRISAGVGVSPVNPSSKSSKRFSQGNLDLLNQVSGAADEVSTKPDNVPLILGNSKKTAFAICCSLCVSDMIGETLRQSALPALRSSVIRKLSPLLNSNSSIRSSQTPTT